MNLKRAMALNLVAVVLGGLGLVWVRQSWIEFDAAHGLDRIQPRAEPAAAVPAGTAVAAAGSADQWNDILNLNPFSFDRNDIPILVSPVSGGPGGPQGSGPKPVLFGTIHLGNDRMALLAPGQDPNRGYRPARVGESVDGWEVVEIGDKTAVVKSGERKETVIMNDPTAQVQRDHTRTLAGAGAPAGAATAGPAPAPGTRERAAAPAVTTAGGAPPPLDANGQPKKGRWLKTPFGDVFIEERP